MSSGLLVLGLMVQEVYADLTLDALIDVLDAPANAVIDLSLEYEMRVEYADMASKIEEANTPGQKFLLCSGPIETKLRTMKPFGEFYWKHEKLGFINTKGRVSKNSTIVTYNGEQGKTYKVAGIPGQPGMEHRTALVANRPTEQLRIDGTPIGYIACFSLRGFDDKIVNLPEYLRLIRDVSKTDRLDFDTEIKRINDCNAISLRHWRRVNRNDNGEEIDLLIATYYFSVDHDLSLVRKETMESIDQISCRNDVYRFEKLSNGIWFPMECAFIDFAPDGTSNIFKVTKVTVNQGLTEKDFDVTFPPGTEVTDRITGKRYVVKPTQEQLDESLPK